MSWVKVSGHVQQALPPAKTSFADNVLQLNQFHWHIVDSQSFPLQIPGFTDLAAKGAYSSSQQYSPKDVHDIVAYAGAVSLSLRSLSSF